MYWRRGRGGDILEEGEGGGWFSFWCWRAPGPWSLAPV